VEVEEVRIASDEVEAAGVRAKIIVGADGIRSIFHRRGPFRRSHPRRERLGICTVIRGYPGSDTVDIYLSRRGEAYAGPAGAGEASLAVLLERGTTLGEFLNGIPALRKVELIGHTIGASPLSSRVAPIVHGRALLIGDAAGVVDPISGEGMSLALSTAPMAAEVIHEAIASGDLRVLDRYAAERRRRMEPARRLAGLILGVSRYPWLADRAVRRLSRDPALFTRLLRAACGAGSIGLLEPARLVL
jgi:flavin-dependent dehydrogenase